MIDVEMMMDLYDKNGHRGVLPKCRKCPDHHVMVDDGECSEGCCDDFKCPNCGWALRVECGD
jgi:hypothetical protein